MCHLLIARIDQRGNHTMERFLELHRKIRSKLCKEVFGHTMAVIVFSGLVIISIVDVLKERNPDVRKLLSAVLGICHFGLCATAILHLKYNGVMELNPLKCRIWIYLEVYNIAATTAFIVLATRYLLPAPFHQWTGTALLLIIYWLPLIMYKTSQVCRMLELVSILNHFQEGSVKPLRNTYYTKPNPKNDIMRSGSCPTTSTTTVTQTVPMLATSQPLSSTSPHIPFEWTLIDSINNAIP